MPSRAAPKIPHFLFGEKSCFVYVWSSLLEHTQYPVTELSLSHQRSFPRVKCASGCNKLTWTCLSLQNKQEWWQQTSFRILQYGDCFYASLQWSDSSSFVINLWSEMNRNVSALNVGVVRNSLNILYSCTVILESSSLQSWIIFLKVYLFTRGGEIQ